MTESTSQALSRRPYLLRAMHEWMSDSGFTPHIIVMADAPGAEVPRAYVKDGKIVLNVSHSATQRLNLGSEWVEFEARFAGVIQHVRLPISAVVGVYARETGEGMVFSEQDNGTEPPNKPSPSVDSAGAAASKRPQLTVVK